MLQRMLILIDAYNVAWMKNAKISTAYTFDRKHFSRFEEILVKDISEK